LARLLPRERLVTLQALGTGVLRYGLVFLLLLIGTFKPSLPITLQLAKLKQFTEQGREMMGCRDDEAR
jgi:hypothetical protein